MTFIIWLPQPSLSILAFKVLSLCRMLCLIVANKGPRNTKEEAMLEMLNGKDFGIWCWNSEMEETLSWLLSRKGMTPMHAADMNCLQVGEKLTLKLQHYAPCGRVYLRPLVVEIERV